MPQLDCTVPTALWERLPEESDTTRQPVAHIVTQALGNHLDIVHHTLFQVSTSTALVEGIYQGGASRGLWGAWRW
jgi:acetolactate decarboxylase